MSKRTYDWNGHKDMPIMGPQFTDKEVAGMVRMLMRSDLNHEMIVCLARDRIMCLVKEQEHLLKILMDIANTGNTGDNPADIACVAIEKLKGKE